MTPQIFPGDYATPDYVNAAILANGSSGQELDADADSTVYANIAVSQALALEITFTVADRPVWVELHLPFVYSDDGAFSGQGRILDGSNNVITVAGCNGYGVNGIGSCLVRERITTPGSYTRRGAFVTIGGTPDVNFFDGTATATLRAVEA